MGKAMHVWGQGHILKKKLCIFTQFYANLEIFLKFIKIRKKKSTGPSTSIETSAWARAKSNAWMGKCSTASDLAASCFSGLVLGSITFCCWHPQPMPVAPNGQEVGPKSLLGEG